MLEEIERVARLLAEGIQFIGAITIDFIVSPAQALYVGNIYPFPNELALFTTNKLNVHFTSALRDCFLPLSYETDEETESIFVPFYEDQLEVIERLITIYPDLEIHFYPIVKKNLKTKEAVGHIIIETKETKKILGILAENDL